jgi:hypothetical protein
MAVIRVIGSKGVNKDLTAHDIDSGFVTDANNVRFNNGMAEMFGGYSNLYDPVSVAPYHVLPIYVGTTRYLIYASKTKVYVVNGATHTNITRQTASVDVDYAADETILWNGGVLNGIPVLNNGVDVPQMWNPVSTTTKLAALTAWDPDLRAKVIRPYKNYLVALHITDTSATPDDVFPHRVLWSHSATAGTVPSSWDITDATKDAGEVDLDGQDHIVDGLQMGHSFVIYKKRSTHVMRYIGGQYVMQFQKLYGEAGAMSQDCVVDVDGAHVVLGVSDLWIHSGSGVQSLLTRTMRDWLFNNMDSQYYERSFLVKNIHKNEVWVCFPSLGSDSCDKALVWNYKDTTFAIRDLPDVRSGANGALEGSTVYGWDTQTATWDTVTGAWNVGSAIPDEQRLILASPDNTDIYLMDSSTQNAGTAITATMERTGLSFGIPERHKIVTSVMPRMKGLGESVSISVGAADDVYGTYSWTAPQTFTIGTDFKVDLLKSGRYFGYRLASTDAEEWRLEGLDFEVKQRGKF